MGTLVPFLALLTLAQWTVDAGEDYTITIRMDKAVSDRPDDLVCIGRKLEPDESYIVEFTPHASKATVHHLMVYGCHLPAVSDFEDPWKCYDGDGTHSNHSVCGDGDRQIFFAWALDAPEKTLPDGVGFRVAGDTGINYLVIQLHYAKMFPEGVTDSSGVTLHMTKTRPPQQAGYIVVGTWGHIPPQMPDFHMESMCLYERNYTVYPIGYRTHAHNLGVVTSGYRIRDHQWTEIGRMSPQLPQTFYDVSNPGMDLEPGDLLAGRCTMNSMARQDRTKIGPTNHDEMCNFYIMYSTYYQGHLVTDYCFQDGNSFHWSDNFAQEEIPPNASALNGIPGADEVREKFGLKPR
ncbi:peptidylglycine alpha-hydroxylating monooxygenase [Aplysia californica]|uniref:peptidylglycine monooxygenase n=1 Tax=Aplysia californica TaxID=6500 RepID=A0ABM0JV07_APLCA|nr:peptidylglycine alpha-hydroxylating monooxygenase [Aplysia californica]